MELVAGDIGCINIPPALVNSPSIVAVVKHNKLASKVVVPLTSTLSEKVKGPVIVAPPINVASPPNCDAPATFKAPVVVKLLAVIVDGDCVVG